MNFAKLQKEFGEFLTEDRLLGLLAAVVIFFVGAFLARKLSQAVMRLQRLDTQQKLITQKVTYYGLMILVTATALGQLGFELKVLLGAAGLLTVAIGFAAQTSASNLISGLFLIVDRPFVAGDVIEVAGIKGEVMVVDLLSTKIRTFDNVLVRVPNETMNKSDIRNMTYFPIRRIDLKFAVNHKESLSHVRDVLTKVADRNPLSLQEPPPLFLFDGFSDMGMNIQFSVWTLRENMTDVQITMTEEIKNAFRKENIEIPYPHRTMVVPKIPQLGAEQQS